MHVEAWSLPNVARLALWHGISRAGAGLLLHQRDLSTKVQKGALSSLSISCSTGRPWQSHLQYCRSQGGSRD